MDDATPLPSRLLPFTIPAERAREAALAWFAAQALAPADLAHAAVIEQVTETYVPFWSFSARVFCPFTALAGSAAQDGSRGRSVTDWAEFAGVVEERVSHVLVPATAAPLRRILERLTPWPTDACVPCPSSLEPVVVDPCAAPRSEAIRFARAEMLRRIRILCIGEIPGHRHRALRLHPEYHDEEATLIALPAWRIDYRYGSRMYQLWVNGCTARVEGDGPISRWKAAATVLLILALLGALGWIALALFRPAG